MKVYIFADLNSSWINWAKWHFLYDVVSVFFTLVLKLGLKNFIFKSTQILTAVQFGPLELVYLIPDLFDWIPKQTFLVFLNINFYIDFNQNVSFLVIYNKRIFKEGIIKQIYNSRFNRTLSSTIVVVF